MLSTAQQQRPRDDGKSKVIRLALSPDHKAVTPELIPDIYLGDRVRFVATDPHYWVRISISGKTPSDPETPFDENPIVGSGTHEVKKEGVFEFKCLISIDGGATWIGWENGSGGEIPIPPR